MWTLDQGLEIIRRIQSRIREMEYHVCLGGSVLNKGQSAKDLDLFILRYYGEVPVATHNKILAYLGEVFGELESMASSEYSGEGLQEFLEPFRAKMKAVYQGKRIDLFVQ